MGTIAAACLVSIGCGSSAAPARCVPASLTDVPALQGGGATFPTLIAGDLDGDGDIDLAASGTGVTVLLGNGDGTFCAGGDYDRDLPAIDFVLAADFNGDRKPDLVTASRGANYASVIHVLPGDGHGAFGSPVTSTGGEGLAPVLAAGDFDSDGATDLAITRAYEGRVGALLGNGDGSFQAPVETAAPAGGRASVIAADLDHDDQLDLALAVRQEGRDGVIVLLGSGDGTFPTRADTPAASGGAALFTLGDFNGDGLLDAAVAADVEAPINFDLACEIGILLGNGDGTFQSSSAVVVDLVACDNPMAGDFNGDGKLDVAIVTDKTIILLGNGDGSLGSPVRDPTYGLYERGAAAADFDGDGRSDLAIASGFDVRIILGGTIH